MPSGGMVREKVVSYLAGLTPDARAMLLRRLETSERGNRLDPDSRLILDVARTIGKTAESSKGPIAVDARNLFFQPFARYIIDEELLSRPVGWIQRSSIDGIWTHLSRDLMPAEFALLTAQSEVPDRDALERFETDVAKLRSRALDLLARLQRDIDEGSRAHRRFVTHIGGEVAYHDLGTILGLRDRLPVIARLLARVPASVVAGEPSEKQLSEPVSAFLEARPDDLAWVATALLDRLSSPYLLARLAVAVAGSAEAVEIRRAGAGPLMDIAVGSVERCSVRLHELFDRRAAAEPIVAELRVFHDVIRGITMAAAVEEDREWHTRLAAARRDVSALLTSAFARFIPSIRAGLRADERKAPDEGDRAEALRAATLYAAVRRYRAAFALNDLLTRLDPTVNQAVEVYGRDLIEHFRKSKGAHRAELAATGKTLVTTTELILGEEHAAVLRRAWDKVQKTMAPNPFA